MVSCRITRIRADWVPGTERGLDIQLGEGVNILAQGKEESHLLDLFRWGLSGRTSASDDPPRSVLKWMWDLKRDLNLEVDITTEEGMFSIRRNVRTDGPSVDEKTPYRLNSYADVGTHCFRRGERVVAHGDKTSGKLTTASELEFVFGTADPELLAVRAPNVRSREDEEAPYQLNSYADVGIHCFRRGERAVAHGDKKSGKLKTESELEFVSATADPELLTGRAPNARSRERLADDGPMTKLRDVVEARKRHHVFGPLMLDRADRFLEPLDFSITALRELVGEGQLILIMDQRWRQVIEQKNDAELEVVNL
jgi:hypothetical protein